MTPPRLCGTPAVPSASAPRRGHLSAGVMTRRLVTRANGIVLGVLIAILLVVGGITWDRLIAAREARDWSRHSYLVLDTVKDLNLAMRDAETGQRGYLLTGDNAYLAPYERALQRVTALQGMLQKLTVDNPTGQDRLRDLGPLIQHKLEELAQTIQLRREGDTEAALRLVRTDVGRTLMLQVETMLGAMTAEETTLLDERLRASDHRAKWVRALTTFGTALALIGLLWAASLLNQAWRRASDLEAEQRRAAGRLQTAFDSLSQGVAVFDGTPSLAIWNDRLATLLALPDGLLQVDTPYDAVADATREPTGERLLETSAQIRRGSTTPGQSIAYERERGDGTQTLEVRRTGTPDGGFVLTVSDMTSRVKAEGVLREAQKMQAIGQLTGGIAHDFNNLLTVILGNLEVLRGRLGPDSPLQSRIERGVWAAERGATLTRQLLAFARKQPLAPKAIDLCGILPTIVPLLRRTLGEPIDVRYVETSGIWPALADAAQVESALLNLALNARDAMPGGGRLTIEVANKVLDDAYCRANAEVAPGDYAMLAVTDTGTGMPPDVLARVFEPFFTTKPDGKGTGLGLAMVFGFVKQSGGHIKIYSEPGHGTTVRLYLPRAVGAAATVHHLAAPAEAPRGSATILVVEDEAAVREIAVTILRESGYRVFEAPDGDEAVRLLGTLDARIDLLLTDVVLPGTLRGRELAERVTALQPGTAVLFMSGYTENSIVHGGRLDDGVELIGKPFHREELARKVAEVLRAAGWTPSVVLPLRKDA